MVFRVIRWFLFSLIVLVHPLFAKIMDEKGAILPEVMAVFTDFKPLMSSEEQKLLEYPSLKNLNTIAQSLFLRPSGLERKDIVSRDSIFSSYATPYLRGLFKKIGDIGDVKPNQKHYRYILISGATVQNMRQRLATLIELVESKSVEIDESTQLVLLTGDRDLFDMETKEVLLNPAPLSLDPSWKQPINWPTTEAQAFFWIFEQTLLPASLRQMTVIYVVAPKKQKIDLLGNSTFLRPTTEDTLNMWLEKYDPTAGSCLSISTQPFVYYQDVNMRNLFAKVGLKGFTLETVGDDQSTEEGFKSRLPVYLDNLARTIYSELQLSRQR
jgi:hypothetical protein